MLPKKAVIIIMLTFLAFSVIPLSPNVSAGSPVYPWKSCDASNVSFGTVANSACDGDGSTRWATNAGAWGNWIRGNLTTAASAYEITALKVTWNVLDDLGPNIAIQTWSGTAWINQLTAQNGSNVAHTQRTYTFPVPVVSTAIRLIQFTTRNTSCSGSGSCIGIDDMSPVLQSVPPVTVQPNFTLSWILGILIVLLTLLGFAKSPAALFLAAFLCVLLSVELFNQIGNLTTSAIIMGLSVFLVVIGISEVRS